MGSGPLFLALQFLLSFLEGTRQPQLRSAEKEESLAPAQHHRAATPALDCLPPQA